MVDMEHEEWLEAQKEQEETKFGWRAKLSSLLKGSRKVDEDAEVKDNKKVSEEDAKEEGAATY